MRIASLIQALAGRFQRNVCYLSSLSHPEMTDDNLKSAVQRVPPKSIVVLEDVDALFGDNGRGKRHGDKSALTFSGVLNALDGVGGSTGQVFVLTTNHRERLDPALIRQGRVDVHVEFTDATREQMVQLFSQFYKEAAPALAEGFAEKLTGLLGDKSVSMACLQAYFITMRKEGAEAARDGVQKILDEMEAHGLQVEKKKAEEEEKADKKGKKEGKKGASEGSSDEESGDKEAEDKSEADEAEKPKKPASAKSKGGKEIHVHVHVE